MKTKETTKETIKKEKISIIDEWKKTYKRVFKTVIDDEEYIWRRILRKEYSAIMDINDGETIEERIYSRQKEMIKTVVLNIDDNIMEERIGDLAGLVTSLSEEVLLKSGFTVSSTEEL